MVHELHSRGEGIHFCDLLQQICFLSANSTFKTDLNVPLAAGSADCPSLLSSLPANALEDLVVTLKCNVLVFRSLESHTSLHLSE